MLKAIIVSVIMLTGSVIPPVSAQVPSGASSVQSPAAVSATSPQSVRVRKGTLLQLQTEAALDPDTAKPHDDVPLRLTRALYVEGVTLLPAGAVLHGTVSEVTQPLAPNSRSTSPSW